MADPKVATDSAISESRNQEPPNQKTSETNQKNPEETIQPRDASPLQGAPTHTSPMAEEVDDDDSRDPVEDLKPNRIPDSLVGNLCTAEEKELSDLRKKGLIDDGATGAIRGDFTLNDLPQLRGDEACSIQWTTLKRRAKDSVGTAKDMCGLSDDELASILQACPDLDSFITKP